jgi:hypothetical protein
MDIFTITTDVCVEGQEVELEVSASTEDGSDSANLTLNTEERTIEDFEVEVTEDHIEDLTQDELNELCRALVTHHQEPMNRLARHLSLCQEVELTEPKPEPQPTEPELELSTVADWFCQESNDGRLAELISEMLKRENAKTQGALFTAVAKHLGGM